MDGVLIVDKPIGPTSFEVVSRVKEVLKIKKAGHTGTLDPLASGVLPLCLGEATKIVPFLVDEDKEYEGVLRLGIETDTQDSQGKILREAKNLPQEREIIRIFGEFKGRIRQTPPMFSAIKQKGIPLYKLARRGIEIQRSPREVNISRLEIKGISLPQIYFILSCSKGTYVRTLCSDIGKRLGCGGHLSSLRRLRSGNFDIKDSLSLKVVEILYREGKLRNYLISLDGALSNFPRVEVDTQMAQKLRKGRPILASDGISFPHMKRGERFKITSSKDELIAVAEFLGNAKMKEAVCRLVRVFNPLYKNKGIW